MHEDSKIIDALGGTAAVARLFAIKPPSVSEWRKSGIPQARRMYLEVIRPDVFAPNASSGTGAQNDWACLRGTSQKVAV